MAGKRQRAVNHTTIPSARFLKQIEHQWGPGRPGPHQTSSTFQNLSHDERPTTSTFWSAVGRLPIVDCYFFLRRRPFRRLRRMRRRLLPIFLLPLCFFGYPMGLYRLTTSLLIKSRERKHTYRIYASPRLVARGIRLGSQLLSTSAQRVRTRRRYSRSEDFRDEDRRRVLG